MKNNLNLRYQLTRALLILVVACTTILAGSISVYGQCFPDSVKEFVPGINSGFGSDHYPSNVLGPPHGTLDPTNPNFSPVHIFSLGTGGSITLEFSSNRIIDLPGPDFTIFENPVELIDFPDRTFSDTAIVSVSNNGSDWITFPFDMISSHPSQVILKANFIGFAGVEPSFSAPDNGLSPFDPAVSGGDQFDLATIGVNHVRFIRITDSGDALYKPVYDTQNDVVYDYGNLSDPSPTIPGASISSGFDLDAIAAIHSEPYSPSNIHDWQFYD